MPLTFRQCHFYDKTVKIEKIKNTISSPREFEFIDYLRKIDFKLDIHYVHQFACCQEEIGMVAVADFAFPNEKIIIELDGKSHKHRKQKELDYKRDRTFIANGFMILRIKTPMSDEDKIFYKYLIKDLYEERNTKFRTGETLKGGRICKTFREE